MSERFAIVYPDELDALRALSSHAAKVLVWYKMGGAERRTAGVREVAEGTGLSKDQAARAIRELCSAALLAVEEASAFTAKRKVATYRVVNAPAARKARLQSHRCDSEPRNSRTSATMGAAIVAPVRRKPPEQSHQCDTPISASSASPQRREDEEAIKDRTGPRRVSQLASDLRLPLMALLKKTDGPSGADFLALKRQRGEMTLDDVRLRLEQPPDGFGRKPSEVEPRSAQRRVLGPQIKVA